MERSIAELVRRLSMIAILQQRDSKISFTQGEFRPRCSEVDHHRNLCGTDVFKILYRKIMMSAYRKQKTTKFRSSERVHLDRKSTLFILLPLCIIFTNFHVLSILSLSFITILLHFETHFWRGGVDNKMAIRRR